MTAKDTKERQQDFRARQRLLGLAEVRGIYLPPELHAKLKEIAHEMLDRSCKT